MKKLKIYFYGSLMVIGFAFIAFTVLNSINQAKEINWSVIGGVFVAEMLACLFLSDARQDLKDSVKKQKYNVKNEENFNALLLDFIAHIFDFNPNSKDAEFEFLQNTLLKYFDQKKSTALIAKLIKHHLYHPVKLEKLFQIANQNLNQFERLHLLFMLIGILAADKLITKKEKLFLNRLKEQLNVTSLEFDSILSLFTFQYEEDRDKKQEEEINQMSKEEWEEFYRKKQQERLKKPPKPSSIETAFSIMELPKNASLTDVKKQYRKLALKYHPDQVSNLGKEHIKIAEEKFKKIVNAYETLKIALK